MAHVPPWNARRLRSGPRRWIVLAVLAFIAWRFWSANDDLPAPPLAPGDRAFVRRVVDGDTLLLGDGQRVRLLGVDTPETVREGTPVQPWGHEAHEFTEDLVEQRDVRLEFDRERFDKYRRVLAYVYVGEKLLNEELLRAGLGRADLRHPYSESMKRRFRKAEQEAKSARRGIWSDR